MKPLEQMRILIVGLGLIGGSIARGLHSRQACSAIDACGRDAAPLRRAESDGVIDRWSSDLSALAGAADMIVLCVPTLSVRSILQQVRQHARPDAIITDAASVKGTVVEDVRAGSGEDYSLFEPADPIAG